MKVIKHGKFYDKNRKSKLSDTVKCLDCKCVFRYSKRDLIDVRDPRENDGIDSAVACPECDSLTYLDASPLQSKPRNQE